MTSSTVTVRFIIFGLSHFKWFGATLCSEGVVVGCGLEKGLAEALFKVDQSYCSPQADVFETAPKTAELQMNAQTEG